MMAGRNPSGDKRRGIQSVEIGLRVLAAVAQNREPSSLSTIAKNSDLSASQAHRYLASLMASGMVKQDGRAGLYDLDFEAIKIGLSALVRLDSFALADQTCRELSQQTGRTCLLAVWGDAGPVIVRWFAGSPAVTTSLAIGSSLPVLQSATGRIFLAFAEPSLVKESVQREARGLGRKAAESDDVAQAVRAKMSASIEGDLIPGLRAQSAPVFDLQGRLIFAVTLIANANFDAETDDAATIALKDSCRSLTEALGGSWPAAPA